MGKTKPKRSGDEQEKESKVSGMRHTEYCWGAEPTCQTARLSPRLLRDVAKNTLPVITYFF